MAGVACSLPHLVRARRRGGALALVHPVAVRRGGSVGVEQISQVPGESLCACPGLGPRRSRRAQVGMGRRCGLPPSARRRPPRVQLSGFDHAAHTLVVYASQPGSPQVHARLTSGWRPTFAGRGSAPRRTPIDGFGNVRGQSIITSSIAGLVLAQADPCLFVRISSGGAARDTLPQREKPSKWDQNVHWHSGCYWGAQRIKGLG